MTIESCVYCKGTGRDPNTDAWTGYKQCPVCKGHSKRSIDTPKDQLSDCSYCNRTGRDPNTDAWTGYKPCPVCEGWGSIPIHSRGISKSEEKMSPEVDLNKKKYSNRVFIVHGHDDLSKERLAHILLDIGLTPIILHDQPNNGRTLIEKFEEEASDVGYAFILMTPDDLGYSRKLHEEIQKGVKDELSFRPRQNVFLELGFFYSKLGRRRVCCLVKGNIERPSNISGIVYLQFNDKVDEVYRDITKELNAVGYKLKL